MNFLSYVYSNTMHIANYFFDHQAENTIDLKEDEISTHLFYVSSLLTFAREIPSSC